MENGTKRSLQLLTNIATPECTQALAFYVEDLMREWAAYSQEVAMDSTCMFSEIQYSIYSHYFREY